MKRYSMICFVVSIVGAHISMSLWGSEAAEAATAIVDLIQSLKKHELASGEQNFEEIELNSGASGKKKPFKRDESHQRESKRRGCLRALFQGIAKGAGSCASALCEKCGD